MLKRSRSLTGISAVGVHDVNSNLSIVSILASPVHYFRKLHCSYALQKSRQNEIRQEDGISPHAPAID